LKKKSLLVSPSVDKDKDKTLTKYINRVEKRSKRSASLYNQRLGYFRDFINQKLDLTLDELIKTLTVQGRGPKIDVYDLLSDYVTFLQDTRNMSPLTLKFMLSTIRNFLEFFDVEISSKKFRNKVGMPRVIRQDKEPLTKKDIQTILNAAHSIKLKTYLLFLAATGCRASEALSVRLCDINFDASPATLFIRGEFTKTGVSRTILLTDELTNQLQLWRDYKYRTRVINIRDKKENGKEYKYRYRKYTPEVNKEALLFSMRHSVEVSISGLYTDLLLMFEKTLKRLGGKFAQYEYSKKRMKITFHSFRRFVKSTVSNLGYEPYSELYFMGHNSVSTYYRVEQEERIKIFRKIEPSLTYLDVSSIEQHGKDMESQFEVFRRENLELRRSQEEMRQQFAQVMEMIQDNPKLAHVKPEVSAKKGKR
jgi:integrase